MNKIATILSRRSDGLGVPCPSQTFLGRGEGSIGGMDAAHNFSDNASNRPRLVCVGIGGGIAPIFMFIPSFHGVNV